MYRRLLPLVNKFIMVRQGMLNRAYAGRLVNVDQECIELQTFHLDGTPADLWVIRLDSITEYMTDSRQLDTLALKVKWATSKDAEEPAEGEVLTEPASASGESTRTEG